MICPRCRTRLLSRLPSQCNIFASSACFGFQIRRNQLRFSSDSPSIVGTTPTPAPRPVAPGFGSVVITSTIPPAHPGISGPFTAPEHVPLSLNHDEPMRSAVDRKPSSCLAGTRLEGLNYMKNKSDIFAMEDSDYPDWLWGLLDSSSKQSTTETSGDDISTMNKKQRKRHEKKMAALAASQPRKVPLHEQSIDLTPAPYNVTKTESKENLEQAIDSLEKRSMITKSGRVARRKAIKEANFLRSL